MTDKIRLSLSGGSGRSMKKLLTCPQWFHYEVEGWSEKFTALVLVEGILFHKNSERILNDVYTPEHRIETEKTLLSGSWIDDNGRTLYWDTEKRSSETAKETDVQKAARRVDDMIQKVFESYRSLFFGEIINVERTLVVDRLVNPYTDKEDDGVKRICDAGIEYSGRVDFENPDRINDIKSSKVLWTQGEADGSQQLSDYLYMRSVEEQTFLSNATIHNFSKHMPKRSENDKAAKGCQYKRLKTTRDVHDMHHAYDQLKTAGLWYLNCEKRGWDKMRIGTMSGCTDDWRRPCPFHCLCFPNKYSDEKLKAARKTIYKRK